MEYNKLKNKKFLFFFNTLSAFGGAERQALILMDYLKNVIGAEVSLIAFEDGLKVKEKVELLNIPFAIYPFNFYCNRFEKVYHYCKLIQLIRKFKPDVIIPYVAESNKVAAELYKYSGAKFVFWNQREEGRGLYGTTKEFKLLKKVSVIVSNSTEGQYFIHKTFGIPIDEIKLVNNGIIVPQVSESNNYWHTKLGLKQDDIIISMIANITERKDHQTLLNAWHYVVNNYKGNRKLMLALAGRSKKEVISQLKILAFDLKLCQNIAFIEFVDDVQSLLQESYFCVFSSNLEGCPNGVLEAMAMKKTVIATDIRGIRQALGEENIEDVLAQPNNSIDFGSKIINLLYNNDLLYQLGQKNQQRIKDNFSVEQMVYGYLSII
jgi:glycosyltransferase involved in cell wall biosynthesis